MRTSRAFSPTRQTNHLRRASLGASCITLYLPMRAMSPRGLVPDWPKPCRHGLLMSEILLRLESPSSSHLKIVFLHSSMLPPLIAECRRPLSQLFRNVFVQSCQSCIPVTLKLTSKALSWLSHHGRDRRYTLMATKYHTKA